MPKITYIEHGGREHRVEVPLGLSVMRGAVDSNIPGIALAEDNSRLSCQIEFTPELDGLRVTIAPDE